MTVATGVVIAVGEGVGAVVGAVVGVGVVVVVLPPHATRTRDITTAIVSANHEDLVRPEKYVFKN